MILMTPTNFFSLVLRPSANLLPLADSLESRVALFAFAGQESGWKDRVQLAGGPGRSYWQIGMTAILDVLGNAAVGPGLIATCALWDIPSDPTTIYEAITWHDPLAYEMARRILLADPLPLAAIGDEQGCYACYLRNWRPEFERPEAWPAVYAQALAVVT